MNTRAARILAQLQQAFDFFEFCRGRLVDAAAEGDAPLDLVRGILAQGVHGRIAAVNRPQVLVVSPFTRIIFHLLPRDEIVVL